MASKNYPKSIYISLDEPLSEWLHDMAKDYGLSISSYVRMIINDTRKKELKKIQAK